MSSQSVLLRSVRCVPKRDGIIWDTASILLGSTFLCVLLSAYRRHVRVRFRKLLTTLLEALSTEHFRTLHPPCLDLRLVVLSGFHGLPSALLSPHTRLAPRIPEVLLGFSPFFCLHLLCVGRVLVEAVRFCNGKMRREDSGTLFCEDERELAVQMGQMHRRFRIDP